METQYQAVNLAILAVLKDLTQPLWAIKLEHVWRREI
jgi:hypothetical protein